MRAEPRASISHAIMVPAMACAPPSRAHAKADWSWERVFVSWLCSCALRYPLARKKICAVHHDTTNLGTRCKVLDAGVRVHDEGALHTA